MSAKQDVSQPQIVEKIHDLLKACGEDPNTFEGDLITQQIQTSLRLLLEEHNVGQLKLITRSLKEMRYAYNIFNQYEGVQCVSIFGSARTPEDHPDYITAKAFSSTIVEHGWKCITGAANGIMKAGLEGASNASSFGLSIRLPFEPTVSSVMEGDPKLMIFRYFFTRKLMFVSHSSAVAVFPGGVGTLDELFEVLTLMQTGKAHIMPVVLLEGPGGTYWNEWDQYIQKGVLGNRWMSPEDVRFYYKASTIDDAVAHILKFYKRYHSSRYVYDMLVIRLKSPLTEDEIALLNEEFSRLIASGKIYATPPLPEESDELSLPRIAFQHTRKDFAVVRMLIDKINEL